MISTKLSKKLKIISLMVLGLTFALAPQVGLLAITAASCDPWPTENDQILACLDFYQTNPPPNKTYEPGTDPNKPATFPFTGTWGLDASYSSKQDQVLVVASDPVGNQGSNYTHINGIMADPQTLAPKGAEFQVDQAKSMFRGMPKAIYNPDADKFFVAWEDSRPSGNSRSTYARIVSGTGTPEGNEIVVSTAAEFLYDVAYDPVNHKYLVIRGLNHPEIKIIDESGNVDARTIKVGNNYTFEGFANITVNTSLNEYWATYTAAVSAADTANEDGRVMLQRISASTGEKIGEPIQLSQTRIGHNAFSSTQIEYDPVNQTAVAVWMERGRDGSIAGIWGRPIYGTGTLGNEFPVMTMNTTYTSEGYGDPSMKYNPATGTFFVSAGDWNGGAQIAELDLGGLVYNQDQVINPACTGGACGSFNVALAPTSAGSATFASINYGQVGGTRQNAVGSLPPTPQAPNPPAEPGKINVGSLGVAVNQIYIWSLGAAALLAVLMIVVGGYITLTSAGNAERASRGKTFIFSSLMGLAILFGAYLLLNTINPDLVNFKNPVPDTNQTQNK